MLAWKYLPVGLRRWPSQVQPLLPGVCVEMAVKLECLSVNHIESPICKESDAG